MAKDKKDKFKETLAGRLSTETPEEENGDELVEKLKKGQEEMKKKEEMEARFKLTVRIPKDLREKLQVARIREGITLAELVKNIIEEWLDRNPEKWRI